MPVSVRTTCTTCGEVSVTGRDITLWVCQEDDRLSRYTFLCPACKLPQSRLAPAYPVQHLLTTGAGVIPQMFRLPEQGLPLNVTPLDPDFLIDANLILASTDRLVELLEEQGE